VCTDWHSVKGSGGTMGLKQPAKNPKLRSIVPSAATELQMINDEGLECSLAQHPDLFTWFSDTNKQIRVLPCGRVSQIIILFF